MGMQRLKSIDPNEVDKISEAGIVSEPHPDGNVRRKEARKVALLKALELNYGVVSVACLAVGVSRKSFYSYKKQDPLFKAKAEEINELPIDAVECKLYEKCMEGSEPSIFFFLRNKAAHKGYNEKRSVDHVILDGRNRLAEMYGNKK